MKAFEQQLENFKIKIKSFLRKAISTKHKVVFIEYTSTDCTKELHQFPSAHGILSPFGWLITGWVTIWEISRAGLSGINKILFDKLSTLE